jgi:hypothetical protein
MKSYPVQQHTIDSRQPPFSYQLEGSYGRQLFWRLIVTVLLAAVSVLAWLSLIGFPPGANARTDPSKHSTVAPISFTAR